MTAGLYTWADLPTADGDMLLIINSPLAAADMLPALFDALDSRATPTSLFTIAPSAWRQWLAEQGRLSDRVLFATDEDGADLELNYFLEGIPAQQWIAARTFQIVIGSAPHNLYNEEVKEIFEQRVCLFLRSALFLAHTIPSPYVFAFHQADLLRRFARNRKVEQYVHDSRALIDDLFSLWVREGRPAVSDAPVFDEERRLLAERLGAGVLDYDERSPISIAEPDLVPAIAEGVDTLLRARDTAIERMIAVQNQQPSQKIMRYLRRRIRE